MMRARTRTFAACLASIKAEHSPIRARNGSHLRRGTGPVSYPRQPAPQFCTPDSQECPPLSWHAATGIGLCAFGLLYMAEILLEAFTR